MNDCLAADIYQSGIVLAEMILLADLSSMGLDLNSALNTPNIRKLYIQPLINLVTKMLRKETPEELMQIWPQTLVDFYAYYVRLILSRTWLKK